MLPQEKQIADYLFSEKVNYLAHVKAGKLQRGFIIGLLLVSAVLSYVAGAVGLKDSNAWVSGLTIAAGIVSTIVLVIIPWANWRNHLRIGSDYEALYQDTLECRMGYGQINERRFAALRKRFRALTEESSKAQAQLGDWQIRRSKNRARKELPENVKIIGPELVD